MPQPRMLAGGATVALLLSGGVIARWYWNHTPPPPPGLVVTPPAASEPHPSAASASQASPASPPAVAPVSPTTSLSHRRASTAELPAAPAIMIHVVGAVRHPGLYRLPPKARLADAVHAAGGPRSGADIEAINLASFVQDGEQIRVPTLAERPSLRAAAPTPRAPSLPTARPTRPVRSTARYPLAAAAAAATAGHSSASNASASPPNGPVNINTANAEELDSLPGVGPATAAAILDFRREHGPFQRVEDLLEVRGIGEKKLARMRDRIVIR